MPTMQITISKIDFSSGSGPNMLHTEDGQQVKIWPERAGEVEVGKRYEIPYFDKEYRGIMERSVGKGIIKEVTNGDGSQAPVAPPLALVPSNGGGRPHNTPMGVANAPQGTRERSIQAQAIIKAVIAVGGDETLFQRWLDVHDAVVKGERVG